MISDIQIQDFKNKLGTYINQTITIATKDDDKDEHKFLVKIIGLYPKFVHVSYMIDNKPAYNSSILYVDFLTNKIIIKLK